MLKIEVVQVYESDICKNKFYIDENTACDETGKNYTQVTALKIGNDYFRMEPISYLIRY